jgi:hypothetical protein
MKLNYYYNQKKGEHPWRNNLIYTSLISDDNKVFVKWYHNDSEYHQGKNEVIDPALMEEKWQREVKYLLHVKNLYPEIVPEILDIDYSDKKIFLKIDGVDLWQRSLDKDECPFDEIVPDWQDQMLNIFSLHKAAGLYKYSLHPSSYFLVDGKLRNINYFFTYEESEKSISVDSFLSHVSQGRRVYLKKVTDKYNVNWGEEVPLETMQKIAIDCFIDQYPADFIEKAQTLFTHNV